MTFGNTPAALFAPVEMEAHDWMLHPVEKVEHPAHYGGADNPYETIKVLKAWLTPEQFAGFCLGNALKYQSRAGKKDGESRETDLKKAKWYMDHYLATLAK